MLCHAATGLAGTDRRKRETDRSRIASSAGVRARPEQGWRGRRHLAQAERSLRGRLRTWRHALVRNGKGGKRQMTTESNCPHAGRGRANRDWWPNQLDLGVLHQHSSLSNPMGEAFNYAEE